MHSYCRVGSVPFSTLGGCSTDLVLKTGYSETSRNLGPFLGSLDEFQWHFLSSFLFSADHFFFTAFIEFVTILLLLLMLFFSPQGTWDLNSPSRDQTCTPCIGR